MQQLAFFFLHLHSNRTGIEKYKRHKCGSHRWAKVKTQHICIFLSIVHPSSSKSLHGKITKQNLSNGLIIIMMLKIKDECSVFINPITTYFPLWQKGAWVNLYSAYRSTPLRHPWRYHLACSRPPCGIIFQPITAVE